MKKWLFRIVVVLGIGLPIYILVRNHFTTEKERVRNVITAMASGLETNNTILSVRGIFDHVSENYHHRQSFEGQVIDKGWAQRFVLGLKQQYEDFKVEIKDMDITVIGGSATVELTGRITAARRDHPEQRVELITEPGQERAVLNLEKEDGEWLVTSSERREGNWETAPGP